MISLQIINNVHFHNEIIETIIIKYQSIIKTTVDIIKLHCLDKHLKIYLKNKYPNILFENTPSDFYINATFYPRNLNLVHKKNHYFICHTLDDKCYQYNNIFYLTPLAKKNYISFDVLPFNNNKIKTKIPYFIIQGNLNQGRRNYNLLVKILLEKYDFDFKIKLIGKGELPKKLEPFSEKIILKNNLNFIDFHKEFLDGYGILPLISKETHKQYYTKKLTSTINYSKAYNLVAIIDKDLQDIYQLENKEIYKNDIVQAFRNSLYNFYK